MPERERWSKEGWSKETYIAILALAGLATHLIARFGFHSPLQNWPLWVTLTIGGLPLLYDLLKQLTRGQFGSDLLAGMAIAASVVLGEYLAGSIVVLMLSGGSALEHYATRRASAVLASLAKRMPNAAHKLSAAGAIADIELDAVQLGDQLQVFPHEICPVDGTVLAGRGTMDEAYLTGEPFQIAKVPGSGVLSGAVNGETALTIEVNQLPVDSRYAKIMRVMLEAEAHRPAIRRIADRLGAWYTLVGLSVGAFGWIVGNDPKRFLAVLVIATPCPLLLAIPVAIIGAISIAASRGIIIKNPAILEKIDSCRTIIFDKTGTLTYGKPALTAIVCAAGIDRRRVLEMAASLEQYSKHPLSSAILAAAGDEGIALAQVAQISEKPGQGLHGVIGSTIGSVNVRITGRRALDSVMAQQLPPPEPGMECVVLLDGRYAATFQFRDSPRRESRSFISHLKPRHQVSRIMLLSGDREAEVRHLAAEVGITEVRFGMSPEEKLAIVREEARLAPTLFLGDGANDAPAMQAATIGVAFGQNSDLTTEAADAVVLDASLGKVDELIHIGRRMRRIALESALAGMGLSVIGMGFAAAGWLPPVAGAIAQEVIDAAAVFNALRMAVETADLRDTEMKPAAYR